MQVRRGRPGKEVPELLSIADFFENQYGEAVDLFRKAIMAEEQKARLAYPEKKASTLKGCKYAMRMHPENLS